MENLIITDCKIEGITVSLNVKGVRKSEKRMLK